MQFAISSWSMRSHINKDFPVQEFGSHVKASFGVGAVEVCQMHIPTPDARRLDQIVGNYQAAGVRVVNVPIDVGDISQSDDVKREHDLRLIEFWIDVAAYLGSPAARVNSGSGDLQTAIDSYTRLANYGEKAGVRLVLENHGGLSADLENVRTLMESAGPNFGTCPDFGNFPEEQRYDGLAMMVPRAAMVHAKTYDFDANGNFDDFDFPRCLQIVKDAGYAGYLSVEFEGDGDQTQGVQQTIDLLRKLDPSIAA